MEIKTRPARPEDMQKLSEIDSLCTQGKSLVFHYVRDDFFARSRLYKKWSVFVAETKNKLVGVVAACVKTLKISKMYVPVGYIYDLRIHPQWRRKGISYMLLKQVETYLRKEKVKYAYTYVLGVNYIAKKICKVMGMFYCGEYKVLIFPCIKSTGPKIQLVSAHELTRILPVIDLNLTKYDLREKKPVSIHYKNPGAGSPFLGVFRLSDSMNTTAGLWDSSVHSTKVVDRIPILLRFMDKFGEKFKEIFRIPQFPGTGEKLIIQNLFDIRQKTLDPGMLLDFVRNMQGFTYNYGAHMLMIHLDIRDPLYTILKPKAFLTISGRVLMRTPVAGELPPPLQCMYLDVRDF